MKNPEKVIAWINDSGSTCGTMINGESLDLTEENVLMGISSPSENIMIYILF